MGNLLVNCRPTGFLGSSSSQLPSMKGYSCQCITHAGCCIKRKRRENIKVCVNVLLTSYRQVTDILPTVGQQVAYISGKPYRPSVGRQTTDCRLTVGRQLTDSRPTGFLGSSSSQLPKEFDIKTLGDYHDFISNQTFSY